MNVQARHSLLSPFRVRAFLIQWPADLLTNVGIEMEILILGWYILVETQSVLLLTVFGALRYDDDHFSSFSYQATFVGGYGYQWIDSATTKLNTEIGGGYRRSKIRFDGSQEGDAIARAAVNFEHALNSSTKITDKFLVESGKDDTFLTNDIGLGVKMSDKLGLSLNYLVRNHSKTPDPNVKKTDTLFTANVVFSF